MIILIDNYDSFSYNLYQLLGELGEDIRVVRNDAIAVEDIEKMQVDHILLSFATLILFLRPLFQELHYYFLFLYLPFLQ